MDNAAVRPASSAIPTRKARRLSPEVVIYIDKNRRSVSLSAASSTPITSDSAEMVASARVKAGIASSDDELTFKPASSLLNGSSNGTTNGRHASRVISKKAVKQEDVESELSDVEMLSDQVMDSEDEPITKHNGKSNGKSNNSRVSASTTKVDKGKGRAKYEYTEEDNEQAKRIIEKMREKLDQKAALAKGKGNGRAAKPTAAKSSSKGKGKAHATTSDLEQGSDSDIGSSKRANGSARRKVSHKMRVKDADDFDDDRDFEMDEEEAEFTNSEDEEESELSDVSSEDGAANVQDGSIASGQSVSFDHRLLLT